MVPTDSPPDRRAALLQAYRWASRTIEGMSMEIEYTVVKAFSVKGKSKAITFKLASTWNGMEEWVCDDGKLIVMRQGAGFSEAFAEVFGGKGTAHVVSVSPTLAFELDLQAAPSP